jgi:uncharacterized repeat protein (TIGR01451 family)
MRGRLGLVPRREFAAAAFITTIVLATLAVSTATGAADRASLVPKAASRTDTCGYNPDSAPKPGGGTVQFNENTITRAVAFNGVGLSGHVGMFANDESGLLIGSGGTPSSSAGSTIGKLRTAISAGTSISSISVASPGLTVAVSAKDAIVVGTPSHFEIFTANAGAAVGTTSISLTARTSRGFASGANIADSNVYGQAVPPTLGSGTDSAGRAVAPQIYLTDITNSPNANGGDYEQGGTAANMRPQPFADALYGSWSPRLGTKPINKNSWDLGPNADPIPAIDAFGTPTTAFDEGYGSEVVWKVGGLKAWDPAANSGAGGYASMQPGHTYRVQTIAHDTDQNTASGVGDVGEVCSTFHIATAQEAIDLQVTKVGSPSPDNLPGNITWTMVVTNNGPAAATGVDVSDPLPDGNTFVSAHTAQGSCTGGAVLHCKLGTTPAGAKVTITLVTTPSRPGTVTNTVTVVGNEAETNTANNMANATVRTVGESTTGFCVAVTKVTPRQLFVGRKTMLTIHLTRHGRAVKGVHVRIKGPKVNIRTKASNGKGVVKKRLKLTKRGIVVVSPIASKRCNTKRVRIHHRLRSHR